MIIHIIGAFCIRGKRKKRVKKRVHDAFTDKLL